MRKKIREAFREESGYRQFIVSVLVVSLAYGLYKGVIDNYLAEIVTMTEFDRGVAEFFRELPHVKLKQIQVWESPKSSVIYSE